MTGGTKGAGHAIVSRLTAAGGLVVTSARGEATKDLAAHTLVQADLTTTVGVRTLVATIRTQLGRLGYHRPRAWADRALLEAALRPKTSRESLRPVTHLRQDNHPSRVQINAYRRPTAPMLDPDSLISRWVAKLGIAPITLV